MASRLDIPLHEVQRRFNLDNPWWRAGQGIDTQEEAWPRRAYFEPFAHLALQTSVKRAVVLIGPRRVGKTVMLKHLVARLLGTSGVVGTQVLYVSLDTPLYSGRSLESLVQQFIELQAHPPGQPLWVMFDEVQYLKDWEVHLKSLVDSYPHIRFLASGSAAAALRMKSRESGAGRFTEFILPPLTFAEYLQFAGLESSLITERPESNAQPGAYHAPDIDGLNLEFVNYLNYGGFPEAVMNPAVRANPARFLRQDIVDKVMLKDLPSLYGIGDTQELNRFFNVLAFNTGNEVSLEELSKHAGITKARLADYLEYMEAAYLIRRVQRIDDNARRLLRARTFKVYLTNPSMRAALFGMVTASDEAMDRLAETAVWSQWLHSAAMSSALHYARWREGRQDLEVDLVALDPSTQKPSFAVEVKWTDRTPQALGELRGLHTLALKHPLSRTPLVTTRSYSGRATLDGMAIDFMPVALYCYTIARQVLVS
ncbi:MAG: ATPase [Betaproteobacteria bacterium HGW-Betaproteobacteria-18]|nr:MAG: ATPase [Betaproteobacteria bacterium HGW-Betaproteobacteria-18]